MMEGVSSYLEDENIQIFGHRLTPPTLRFLVTVACFIFGIVLSTQAGVYWFDFYDTYCATGPILLLCVMETILFAFHPATEKLKEVIKQETHEDVPAYFTPALKYVTIPVSAFLFVYAYIDLVRHQDFDSNSYFRFKNSSATCLSSRYGLLC